MNKIRWKTEEIEVLKNNYSNTPTDKLLELLPNRSYVSIKLKGRDLNLSRYYNKRRIIKLDKLLEDTYESAYWLGFLYADGNFYNNKRLTLTLSIKDENHIKKFIKFLEMEDTTCIRYTEINACVSFSDCESVGKLCDRYNILNNKTENPPLLPYIDNKDLFLSFIIGFIDGDGCIKKVSRNKDKNYYRDSYNISIKCHSSWLYNLQYITNFIYYICECKPSNVHLSKENYAIVNIGTKKVLLNLKDKALKFKLPVLKRKWDNINNETCGYININLSNTYLRKEG